MFVGGGLVGRRENRNSWVSKRKLSFNCWVKRKSPDVGMKSFMDDVSKNSGETLLSFPAPGAYWYEWEGKNPWQTVERWQRVLPHSSALSLISLIQKSESSVLRQRLGEYTNLCLHHMVEDKKRWDYTGERGASKELSVLCYRNRCVKKKKKKGRNQNFLLVFTIEQINVLCR